MTASISRLSGITALLLLLCCLTTGSLHATVETNPQKYLNLGFEQMDKANFKKALEYLTKAQFYSEKNKQYDILFTAKNNIGIIYFQLSDYGEALNYYLECYTIALKYLDPKREMTVLNNIAILYCAEKNYNKGEEYFIRAYGIAKRENDPLKIGHYAVNLARVANKTNKLKQGEDYLLEASKLVKDDKQLFLQYRITLAENLSLRGKTIEARKILFELLPKTQRYSVNGDRVELLTHLAESYNADKKTDSAIYYSRQALASNYDYDSRILLYGKLSDFYLEQKEPWKALEMKDSMVAAKDSLEKAKNGRLFENNKVKFELQQYKNDLSQNQQRLNLERKLFFAVMAIVLTLLFFVYRMYRNRAIKQEQQRIIAKRESEITQLELDKEKTEHLLLEQQLRELENEALLKEEKLKNEIEQKNRKLSVRALYLSGRNEMIEEIVHSLSDVPEIAKSPEIKSRIRILKEHLKTDSEWDNFIVHFEEANQGFLHSLKQKHPDLNSNDIRFISYLYMNLSSKEICSIFNITAEALRKRKERIARKMELADNTSLYDYLSSLS